MRKPGGYATWSGPNNTKERDTFTCGHCNTIVIVKPKADPADMGGLCKQCMKLICPSCNNKNKCTPFEKKLEQLESRDRFLRSLEQ